jgi:hypothetical protein
MPTEAEARAAARDWIEAWNARDLDRICAHYAADVELWSPTVVRLLGVRDGRVAGIEELRRYFAKGLEAAPALHFELVDVLLGVDGYAIVFPRESGALGTDVTTVDASGKTRSVRAYYSVPPSA